ncbi:hypothetical protein BGZ67_005786 [Mortierella alpina]|nr:hypothetical protein BGZ67_005786 [Mortierella alpina]
MELLLQAKRDLTLKRSWTGRVRHRYKDVVDGSTTDSEQPYTGAFFVATLFSSKTENIHLGQRLPMTVQFEPFVRASGHYGQELVIISAVVKLKQYTRLWHRRNVKNETKETLNVPVHHGWPQTARGFQRTIWVDLPHAPQLSCTTFTQPVQKTHRLKIIMNVKTSAMADRNAKEFRVEMEVNVTGPRPPTAEGLPPYSAVWKRAIGGVDSD